jgi:hypothetical protein
MDVCLVSHVFLSEHICMWESKINKINKVELVSHSGCVWSLHFPVDVRL